MVSRQNAVMPYIGSSSPFECTECILDLLARGENLKQVILLSSPINEVSNTRSHGFLLDFESLGWMIVSSCYASGYDGASPRELSKILSLLSFVSDNLLEYEMDKETFHRLERHQLLSSDIDDITLAWSLGKKTNIYDYINPKDFSERKRLSLFDDFKSRLPLTNLHPDLSEIALEIFTDPIGTIREVCTILEDSLKKKCGLEESGTKLFDKALSPKKGKLKFQGLDKDGELAGLQLLAKGFFQLHRNPIMHKSSKSIHLPVKDAISQLIIANHLLLQFSSLIDNPEYSVNVSK